MQNISQTSKLIMNVSFYPLMQETKWCQKRHAAYIFARVVLSFRWCTTNYMCMLAFLCCDLKGFSSVLLFSYSDLICKISCAKVYMSCCLCIFCVADWQYSRPYFRETARKVWGLSLIKTDYPPTQSALLPTECVGPFFLSSFD